MFRRTDRLFHRYQETREPRLLGAVFDRTAAELLRVALHLTRNRHRAEDVLQSTFLTAIEKTAQYDPSRPLLPWLLEILANHARQVHRRERRVLPALSQTHEGGDVGDTAAANELAATCDRAIAALPEPYRQVLILHLRHGLSGQEIAAVLTRPDSTVRNQIARGLDLLRRKLPASLTAAVAIGAAGGRGLAAVRTEVLARVPAPAGGAAALAAAASASLFGVMIMGNKVAVSLVLLALVAAGSWYSRGFADPAAALPPGRQPEVASMATPTKDPTLPTPLPVQREAATPSTSEASTGSLHATIVVERDGTPVADAACSVWTRTRPQRMVTQAVTRADGTVAFTLAPGAFLLELDVCGQQEGFTIAAGVETRLRCEVRSHCRLEGTVVDPDGRPVGGAEVRRERQWSSVLLARTAADGTFAAEHVDCSGLVWAIGAGRQPSKRQCLYQRVDTAQVRLVLGGAGTRMSGSVVDEQGAVAADARVFIGLDTNIGSPTFVQFALHDLRADEAGRFAVDWLTPGRVCVAAVPSDQDLARATMREVVVVEAVPVQVQLQLGDGARITGIVRDEDGLPVAGASCDVWFRHLGLDPLSRRSAKTGSDGRFDVRGLFHGRHWVQTSRGGMKIDTSIDLERGQTFEWNPVLGDGAPLAIRVLGPDDEPLLQRLVTVEVGGETKENGWTDEQGGWRCERMPGVEHTVKVYAADYGVVMTQRTIVPGPEEVVIRIDAARMPSARISGRVVDARG
ncbi:MAG TPA: sigma-70 family RNA polymerase sigma factor, partial [Planctomycetota bacterium]|nr:sigma-70 family RNA polymerase sigma factor [Planctomycetota bacterium]